METTNELKQSVAIVARSTDADSTIRNVIFPMPQQFERGTTHKSERPPWENLIVRRDLHHVVKINSLPHVVQHW